MVVVIRSTSHSTRVASLVRDDPDAVGVLYQLLSRNFMLLTRNSYYLLEIPCYLLMFQ